MAPCSKGSSLSEDNMTRTLAIVLGVALVAGSAAGAAAQDAARVDVREEKGTYHVTATFVVGEAPAAALAVLTDYERIPAYMPDVKRSVVRERVVGRALIEQEAEPRLMMFAKRVHLLLDVTEAAEELQFVDRSGRSFSSYSGLWRLAGEGTGTRITYQLLAQPSFSVPSFVLTRLLRKDAARMIEGLRAEIAARAR
jgi:hypothetical protein